MLDTAEQSYSISEYGGNFSVAGSGADTLVAREVPEIDPSVAVDRVDLVDISSGEADSSTSVALSSSGSVGSDESAFTAS